MSKIDFLIVVGYCIFCCVIMTLEASHVFDWKAALLFVVIGLALCLVLFDHQPKDPSHEK